MKKEIQDGLILRSLSEGVASDSKNFEQFFVDVFGEDGDEDAETVGYLAQDYIAGKHPNMTLDDVWVVVDPSKDDLIVSGLLLIPQTWRYEEIEFGVGRIELVATRSDYRRRGLVRELMNVAHERSASLGHLAQGITGIPHYYRRFGYTMAINLGYDAQIPPASVPRLKPNQKTKFTLRPATNDDIPNIQAWDAYEQRNGGLTLKREWANWDFDLNHRHPETPVTLDIQVVVDEDGQDVGFVSFNFSRFYRAISIWQFVIGKQSSYFDTFNDVMRAIKSMADDFYATLPEEKHAIKIRFDNGISPAIKSMIRTTDGGLVRDSVYAWYIRVDDVPAFIKHIAPVLEHRLQGSGMNRFTGNVKIGFYQLNGIMMSFEDGCITDVVSAEMGQDDPDAAMPYDTFLNVLFGHRDVRELSHVLTEAYANQKANLLLSILFPRMRSQLGDGIG